MKKAIAALSICILAPTVALACGGAPICTVKDPTDTPLNIRLGPNDTIVGNASNGTKLEFIDHVEHNGKVWARVSAFDPGTENLDIVEAYVFGAYLKCTQKLEVGMTYDDSVRCTVEDPTETPLNLRVAPGGEILGSLRNETTVQVWDVKLHKGKIWAGIYREPADNAVGWVFDAYLKCEEDGH